MNVEITDRPFDPWDRVREYQAQRLGKAGKYGATTVFVGTMRDFNEGDSVRGMTLEHYPGMTERQLEGICDEALKRWEIMDVLVVHRVGDVDPDEAIVLVAVWASHRASAYEANRFVIEYLKSKAPFWKKERLEEGERWVAENTPG